LLSASEGVVIARAAGTEGDADGVPELLHPATNITASIKMTIIPDLIWFRTMVQASPVTYREQRYPVLVFV
jgi:hypothetical protein